MFFCYSLNTYLQPYKISKKRFTYQLDILSTPRFEAESSNYVSTSSTVVPFDGLQQILLVKIKVLSLNSYNYFA